MPTRSMSRMGLITTRVPIQRTCLDNRLQTCVAAADKEVLACGARAGLYKETACHNSTPVSKAHRARGFAVLVSNLQCSSVHPHSLQNCIYASPHTHRPDTQRCIYMLCSSTSSLRSTRQPVLHLHQPFVVVLRVKGSNELVCAYIAWW